jgi:hypothetical protein
MGIGFAIFSYNGRVLFGFNADYSLVPDLPEIPKLIDHAFRELARVLDVKLED